MTDANTTCNDIIDRIDVGILVVNKELSITTWNNFMATHSGKTIQQVIGNNIFDVFPELPAKWLEKKIKSVFLLKSFAFTSWEQRPYLFKFHHNRPITGGIDYMRQNCTFMPLLNDQGEVESVCITIYDATDTSIYKRMHDEAMLSLKESSIRDSLTGLYNRRYLEEHLIKETNKFKRYGGLLSLIMFDIDYFKNINDTYGHLAGDEILREIASRIQKCTRETDIVGRYGGEEFMTVLTCTDKKGTSLMAERILYTISNTPVKYVDTKINITVSIGISIANDDVEDYKTLISQADMSLYQSKTNGRNQVTYYTP